MTRLGWDVTVVTLPTYVKLYQNNMLLHLRAQQANTRPIHPPTHLVIHSEQSPPDYAAQIVELCSEIAALHLEVEALQSTHEASPNPPSPAYPPAEVTTSHPPSTPFQAHPNHHWLQKAFNHEKCHPQFKQINLSTVPIVTTNIPPHAEYFMIALFTSSDCKYLALTPRGDLFISKRQPSSCNIICSIVVE